MADSQIILLEEHLLVAARQITSRLLMTPVSKLNSVGDADSFGEAVHRMTALGFDQLPVTRADRIVGLVRKPASCDPADATIADAGFVAVSQCSIKADASMPTTVEALTHQPSVLVTDEVSNVAGLIHYADLNRQPMRVYLYLHLSALEMGLAELLRRAKREAKDWVKYLSDHKRVNVLGRFEADKLANVETDHVEGTELSDLLAIFKSDRRLRSSLGYADEAAFREHSSRLADLRNSVMHPVRKLVKNGEGPRVLTLSMAQLDQLTTRVRNALAIES